MNKTTLPRQRIFYKSMPKVELHRHLEGSLRLTTMLEISRKHSLDLPKNVDDFRSLVQIIDGEPFTHQNFLSKFSTLRLFYQSAQVIKDITSQAIEDAALDNIRYMELRFTPVALTRLKDFPLGEAMDWVIEAADEASEKYGVMTRLIANVNRHESLELAEEVASLAVERIDKGIIALDIGGNEADFPGEEFAGIFQNAKQAGLRITAHAAEWGPAENVKMAIEKLGAERIGHGVRVLEDDKVVAMAKERKITFEVCPTSNYQSGVYKSIYKHPLREMIEVGLDVSINTDDPSISQINLSDEYELSIDTLKLNKNSLHESILDAARAAFLNEVEQDILVASLDNEFIENGQS
ncbi:MAG: adenosine deaminase [Chloroflexota bacterium]